MKKILILSCLFGSMVNLVLASISISNSTAHEMEIRTVVDGEERSITLEPHTHRELEEYNGLTIVLLRQKKRIDHLEDGSLVAFTEYIVNMHDNGSVQTKIDFIQRLRDDYTSEVFIEVVC